MTDSREPRELETRSETARETAWTPPTLLPDPAPQPGWVFRWVRTSMVGQSDATNVSMRFREGWEPVRIEDHPELEVIPDHDTKFPGCVEIGGQLLCKAPQELVEERTDYYKQQTDNQIHSVDNNLMRENDPRMPLFHDRKSKVTFGKGN